MKTSKRNKLLWLALAGGFSLFGASGAMAAAGDTVSNFATLNYSVGTAPQTVIESGTGAGNSVPGAGYATANGLTTDFVEDRTINFTVVRGGATGQAVPGGTLQAVQYTVTNTGNDAQGFLLKGLNNIDGTADPFLGTADEFDATSIQTFVESGGPAGYDAADTAAHIASLAPGASVNVYVVSTIPLVDSGANPLVNSNVAVMSLVAQVAVNNSTGIAADAIMADDNSHVSPGGTGFTNATADLVTVAGATAPNGTLTIETVFGDAAGTQDGAGGVDAVYNGQHSDDSSYTIQTAALTVAKAAVTYWDPVNAITNPKSIPGGVVRYTISVTNAAGSADASLTNITDDLVLTLMDTQFGDQTAANAPLVAAGTNNVRITDGTGAVTYCTADANAVDGCTYAGTLGDTVTVDLSVAAGTATLSAGQTLTVEFDVVIQ